MTYNENKSQMNRLKSETASSSSAPSLPASPVNSKLTNVQHNWKHSTIIWICSLHFEHIVAGVSGGAISTLVLHPFDLLKIRFAVNDGKVANRPHYTSLRNAVSTIVKEEGVKGLYRGVTPNWISGGLSWGLYFFFYNSIKEKITKGDQELPLPLHMIVAAGAGLLCLSFTNPIWVVKTRLCLQYANTKYQSHLPSYRVYNGAIDAFCKLYKYEGMRGLYKGFVPGMFGILHGSIQMTAYDKLKNVLNKRRDMPINTKLSFMDYIFCAALSKLFASCITYPLQVVRARLADQQSEYKRVRDVINATWSKQGFKGFYRGFPAHAMHVVPNVVAVFVTYELISNAIANFEEERTASLKQ